MKILFAGGGTGGHFYPIIAVHRALRAIADEYQIIEVDAVLLSTTSYDRNLLRQENIGFRWVPAGKMRRYFSLLNFFDALKTGLGVIAAIFYIFITLPDVIFAKGGYASFPALLAGRLFSIPVIIHESDAVPGRVNVWASGFARRIAISFPESASFFPKKKTALTGHPVRHAVTGGNPEGAYASFGLEKHIPTILVMGGSQGALKLNETVLSILPDFLKKAQIVHQTGAAHIKEVTARAEIILENNPSKSRYHPVAFLNEAELRNLSSIVDIAISRAGAGSIFTLAAWGTPAIIIPLSHAAQDHQRRNAYAYGHTGAAAVIEENNLLPHLLFEETFRIIENKVLRERMKKSAKNFSRPDAADKIAREIIRLALEHAS